MFILFLNGCTTAKKAFSPERKNSSEEFLVEKKSPLALPPDFDELPTPKNSIIKVDQNDDIEMLRPCPEGSIHPYEKEKILGKRLAKDLKKGDALLWKDIKLKH